jgi:flavin reductase (DIM6/NTAB) family NADH-FMN oxidoreductase RutF
LIFGAADFPEQCIVGMRDPQSEVSVWLRGLGSPLDVTHNNVIASASPLTIGVAFENEWSLAFAKSRLSLQFRENRGEKHLLGQIGLRMTGHLPIGSERLYLFEAQNCRNYCLPRPQLWTRYARHAYHQWRARKRSMPPDFQMSSRKLHCVSAFYICPRPVVLVSVMDGPLGNIVPMDLIGPVGTRHFTLALHNTSTALPLIERTRLIALSSVPVTQTSVAFDLSKHHKMSSIDWATLPFGTRASPRFGLPVPQFALRVREMEIETVRRLGSHTLLVATVVEDQPWDDGLQLFQIHGFYQAWRQQQRAEHSPAVA